MAEYPNPSDRLVTIFGGSGFVGRYIVRAFARRGWRVRAAMRRPDLAGFLQPLGGVGQIQAVQANLRYPESVAAAAEGAEIVINAAGVKRETGRQSYEAVHTFGSDEIARAARAAGARALVHVSGIGADSVFEQRLHREQGPRARTPPARRSPTRSSCAPRSCSAPRTTSSIVSPTSPASCLCCRCSAAARPGCSRYSWATSRSRRRARSTASAGRQDLRARRTGSPHFARDRRTRPSHRRAPSRPDRPPLPRFALHRGFDGIREHVDARPVPRGADDDARSGRIAARRQCSLRPAIARGAHLCGLGGRCARASRRSRRPISTVSANRPIRAQPFRLSPTAPLAQS